jgi:hypothetical protein
VPWQVRGRGRSASPCQQEIKRVCDRPSKSKAHEGRCGSPQIVESPLPLPRGLGVPPSRLLAPLRCLLEPPPMARRRALPRPPRVSIPRPLPRPVATGAGDSTYRGWPAPHHSPPPHPTTSSPVLAEGRVPAAHAAGTPCCTTPGAPTARASSPSRTPPAPVLAAARRGRPPGSVVLAGPTVRRSWSLLTDKGRIPL